MGVNIWEGKKANALIEAIEGLPNATQQAADNANAAAAEARSAISDLGSLAAGTYSSTKTYDVGDYVYYNNHVYRCVTPITTAEEWTAAHWIQVALGDDVERNKNAAEMDRKFFDFVLSENNVPYNIGTMIQGSAVDSSGEFVSKTNWERTEYIPLNKNAKNLYFIYDKPTSDSDSLGCFYDENYQVVAYPYSSSGIVFNLFRDNNIIVPEGAEYFVVTKAKKYNLFAYATNEVSMKDNTLAILQTAGDNWVAIDMGVAHNGFGYNSSGAKVSNINFKSTDYIKIGANAGLIYAENTAPDGYQHNDKNWFFDAYKNPISKFLSNGKFTQIPGGAVYIGCTIGKEYNIRIYKVMKDPKNLQSKVGSAITIRDKINDYWINSPENGYYLNNRITSILNTIANTHMVVFTDSHYSFNRMQSEYIVPFIADSINADNIVFGGDAISSAASTAEGELLLQSFYTRMQDAFKHGFRNVLGNHDRNTVEASQYPDVPLDDRIVSYDFLYRQAVSKWRGDMHFEQRDTHNDTEYTYWNRHHYYFDDYNNRIRYIVLYSGNTYEPESLLQYLTPDNLPSGQTASGTSELYLQLEFIYNCCATLSDGWGVFVMGHMLCEEDGPNPPGACVFRLLNGIKARQTAVLGGNARFYTDVHTGAVFDCSNMPKIDIIGVWGGHYHTDVVGVYTGYNYSEQVNPWNYGGTDATGANQLAYIGTACDSIGKRVEDSPPMESGTITEQVIDVISIDRINRRVVANRIGAGTQTPRIVYY